MTYTPGPNDVSYPPPIGTGTPPATGTITVPQSPSGAIITNTNEGVSGTQTLLSDALHVGSPQEGVPILTSAPQMAGVPARAICFYSGLTSGVNL